jgi:hypothetical protein
MGSSPNGWAPGWAVSNETGGTDRTDYPRLLAHELRVGLWDLAKRLGEIEDSLPRCSVAQRRSLLFRLSERLEILSTVASDAAGVVRGHVAALTLQITRQPDFADTVIDMPAIRPDELPARAPGMAPIVRNAVIVAVGTVVIAIATMAALAWKP